MISHELHWKASGQEFTIRVDMSKDHGTCHAAGRSIPFRLDGSNSLEVEGRKYRFYVMRDANRYSVWIDGRTYNLERIESGAAAATAPAAASGEISALMPGKIVRIEVQVGDAVTAKQAVIIMESMKMETALAAPISGRVIKVLCKEGQVVDMGERLMVIE